MVLLAYYSRHTIICQCFKAIFTAPTSVKGNDDDDHSGSRRPIAQIYGLERATPNTIAYACMLVSIEFASVQGAKSDSYVIGKVPL